MRHLETYHEQGSNNSEQVYQVTTLSSATTWQEHKQFTITRFAVTALDS